MSRYQTTLQGQAQGMPRGQEAFVRDATDKQSEYLLARLTRDGAILMPSDGKNPSDCSHSSMMFWKDETGRTRMGIEFSEHLRDSQTEQLKTTKGGMPVYGRYLVTDTQIEQFVEKFKNETYKDGRPLDVQPKLQAAFDKYTGTERGAYYCYNRPCVQGQVNSYVDLRNPSGNTRPVEMKFDMESDTPLTKQVRKNAPRLSRVAEAAASDFDKNFQSHRIIFYAEKVPGAFADNPVVPTSGVDPADVEAVTGDKQVNGAYVDGYRVTFEYAMDSEMDGMDRHALLKKVPVFQDTPEGREREAGYRNSPWANDDVPHLRPGRPSGAYLATYHVGQEIRHDELISPDNMATLKANARFEMLPDGRMRGVVDAPVYYSDHKGAVGTSKSVKNVADVDYPDARAQIMNRSMVPRGGITEKPDKGTVATVLISRASLPEKPADFTAHEKFASMTANQYRYFQKARTDPEMYAHVLEAQGLGRQILNQGAIEQAQGHAENVRNPFDDFDNEFPEGPFQ